MKYIIKRNKIYHFKCRISKHLQFYFNFSTYFYKSLKTESSITAQKNAKIIIEKINYIQQSIKMNKSNIEIFKLIDDLTNTRFQETERDLYNISNVEDSIFALTLQDQIDTYQKAYNASEYSLVEKEAVNIFKSLNLKYDENTFDVVCKQLLNKHIQNLKQIFYKIEHEKYKEPNGSKNLNALEQIKNLDIKSDKDKDKDEDVLTLKSAYALFEKNLEVSYDTLKINRKYFDFLLKYLKNKKLDQIKKRDFIDFKSVLNEEQSNGVPIKIITKKRYINLANRFFKYLYNNDLIQISIELENYKSDLSEKIESKKENYSNDEMKKWYNWAVDVNDDIELKFITLLSMYNGFSISEITRLEKHNIFEIENIVCVEVEFSVKKRTKNENRIRIVPLHKELIKLGFLEYVKNAKNNFLFHIDNRQFSRKMTDINREFITKNKKRTFHRIRASFINNLVQNGERAEYVAALVGHSQEYKITLETYADNINVKLLSSALLKLNYGF